MLGNCREICRSCHLAAEALDQCDLRTEQALRERAPLFKKLDESVIEEEYARLEV